ncbi:hypothetical protein CYMTET_43121 [Cymbomonas tetramitiformis]|uniref:Uncharacterized protein n=1 Tax=Cymbomonas tetramitiformis TaxID=36881 RepID=A0AAE0C2W4_9CHLO|nr:hypothetical protein CYMTET_43121 [Cymbomonas tetramitiformis]
MLTVQPLPPAPVGEVPLRARESWQNCVTTRGPFVGLLTIIMLAFLFAARTLYKSQSLESPSADDPVHLHVSSKKTPTPNQDSNIRPGLSIWSRLNAFQMAVWALDELRARWEAMRRNYPETTFVQLDEWESDLQPQILAPLLDVFGLNVANLDDLHVEDEVVRGAAAGRSGAGGSSRGAGILVEEAQALHNAKNMAMTFWNKLSGLAGDAEFDKVGTYLRMIIEKQIAQKEGGNMINQFKKERMVQKHLVSAAGLETWEEFKEESTAYWSSQEKIEGLIGCLPGNEPTHEEDVTMYPPWKIVKSSFEDLTLILRRLSMTGAIIDGNCALDKEKTPDAMTEQAVKILL